MDYDTWSTFEKQHMPKGKDADMTKFRTRRERSWLHSLDISCREAEGDIAQPTL